MTALALAAVPAGTSPVHRLDPRAKLLGLLAVTVVAVSTPLALWPVWLACAGVLAAVAALGRVGPRELLRRARILLPLVALAALFMPFARTGGAAYELGPLTVHEAGLETAAAAIAKASLGALAAVLLAATTAFPDVLRGLEAMRVPRLFVLIAAFMYRYLFVIAAEAGRMRHALAARGHRPRHLLHGAPLGRLSAALFLRTYARGERVYLAMLARGYRGRMPDHEPLAFSRADAAFLAAILLALPPLRAIAGIAA